MTDHLEINVLGNQISRISQDLVDFTKMTSLKNFQKTVKLRNLRNLIPAKIQIFNRRNQISV